MDFLVWGYKQSFLQSLNIEKSIVWDNTSLQEFTKLLFRNTAPDT